MFFASKSSGIQIPVWFRWSHTTHHKFSNYWIHFNFLWIDRIFKHVCMHNSRICSIKNQSSLYRNTCVCICVYNRVYIYYIINIIMAYTQVIQYIIFSYFCLIFGYGTERVVCVCVVLFLCLLSLAVSVSMNWVILKIHSVLWYTFRRFVFVLFLAICWCLSSGYQVIGDSFYHPDFCCCFF